MRWHPNTQMGVKGSDLKSDWGWVWFCDSQALWCGRRVFSSFRAMSFLLYKTRGGILYDDVMSRHKIISIKPVVKCPEDKSHLIHCVLTCNAPLCPKEATELLFIWTLCQALTCPLSSQALLQTYCHNKQYRKHLEVCLAQKEGKENLWGLWKAGAHVMSGTPGTHQILSPEIGRQN